jgi:site-specific DNA recombinase
MTMAVIYARFSPRPNAAESESVEMQLERCRAYCTGQGYTVAAEHFDKDLSGGRADNRPGLQAALKAACERRAVLVVYSLSRLARNTKDALALAERLQRCRADLAAVREQIDTHSPMGRFIFVILAALAELEREQIRDRTSDAMQRHQATGRRMSRLDRAPYGWQPDEAGPRRTGKDGQERPARLIPHPEEQAIIGRIQKLCAEGLGLRQIARALDEAGLSCRGCRWHHSTIKAILGRAGQLAAAS